MTVRPMKRRIEFLPAELTEAEQRARHEARVGLALPALIKGGHGHIAPAVVLDISATGMRVLVDERSSPGLPVPPGARLRCEFYFGPVEIRDVEVLVTRVDEIGAGQLELGCAFERLPATMRAELRREVARRASARATR